MKQSFTYQNSILEQIDGIDRFLLNEKTAYETGFSAGKLLVLSNNPSLKFIKNMVFRLCATLGYALVARRLSSLVIPQEYKDELRGYADATGIPYSHLMALNFGHDTTLLSIFGCTSFSFFNPDGSCVIAHNTDYTLSIARKARYFKNAVSTISLPGKHRVTYVAMPCFVGMMNGWNDAGLAIISHAIDLRTPIATKHPFSTPLLMRYLLEHASTIGEVESLLQDRLPALPANLMVTSMSEHRNVALEITPDEYSIFEKHSSTPFACTNHFRSERFSTLQNKTQIAGSYDRIESCESLLRSPEMMTVEKAITILQETSHGLKRDTTGHSLTNEGTFQSFVITLPRNEITISNGDQLPVSLNGSYVTIPVSWS